MTDSLYLVADVGGTNTRVGLADDAGVRSDTIRKYANREHANLAPVLRHYVEDVAPPALDGACVAVAGPVADERAELTNLDWSIDRDRLQEVTGAPLGAILNDLQAQGHALGAMPEGSIRPVIEGPVSPHLTKLVIGVGTGFNAVSVLETESGKIVPPSEAGHANLPIRTEDELRLCHFVSTAHGFPAVEDVLSGRGLQQVYRWLASEAGTLDEFTAAEIMDRMGTDPLAEQAVRTFVCILGTVAGNLSLIHMPLGGVYLIGGVARAMAPHLHEMGFTEAFRDKGRFAGFMSGFAVHLIDDDFAALTGCAAHLRERVGRLTEN